MSFNYTTDLEHYYLFKILVIGESGVGKTALLQRFFQDYFATDYVATIGVEFQGREIHVDSKCCKLEVWDTAGQDRFKCVVSTFYRGVHGVMICFDITDLESFRDVDRWLEEVTRYGPENTPVFLIGTKADLQSRRMVSYAMIKDYAEHKKLTYIETSSKTRANVEDCFYCFSRILIKHTDQIELFDKPKVSTGPIIDLKKKPVTGGGCFGSSSCVI